MTPAIVATAILPGQPLAPAIPPVAAAPAAPVPRASAAPEFMVDLDEPEATEPGTDAAWQFAQVGDPPRATPVGSAEVRLATGPAPVERKAENPVEKPVDPAATLWMTQAGALRATCSCASPPKSRLSPRAALRAASLITFSRADWVLTVSKDLGGLEGAEPSSRDRRRQGGRA